MAAWHASWLDAVDIGWRRDEFVWLALEPPPLIYLAGITLSPDATAEHIDAAPGAVYDCWGVLDLAPSGFERWRVETWFLRPPGPLDPGADPPELEIVRAAASEVEEFEAVSVRGFRGDEATVAVGSIHPPNPDPRMTLWLGRVDGRAVSAAMSYRTDRAVGVFGVTTVEPARGRGYSTAVMRRAVLTATRLPAVLNTGNGAAIRVYERLGFHPVGECPQWRPGPVSRTDPDDVLT